MELKESEDKPFLFFTGIQKKYKAEDEVLCLAVKEKQNLLALGFDNGTVAICYLDTFEVYFSSKNDHKTYLWSLEFTKNGDFLFSGDKSGVIIKWDVEKKCKVFQKKIHKENVRDIKIYHDKLISAGDDGKIKILDVESMNLLEEFITNEPCKLIAHQNKIMSVEYSENLFSIDLETKLIKMHPFRPVESGRSNSIWSICFSNERNSFILGNNEGQLIEYKDDQIIKSKKVATNRISQILVYEGYLISCSFDQHIRIHDIDSFEELYSLQYDIKFNSMILVNEKYLIASGLTSNSIVVINLKSSLDMLKILNRKRDLNIQFHFI
jgi:WD40 repeat protein